MTVNKRPGITDVNQLPKRITVMLRVSGQNIVKATVSTRSGGFFHKYVENKELFDKNPNSDFYTLRAGNNGACTTLTAVAQSAAETVRWGRFESFAPESDLCSACRNRLLRGMGLSCHKSRVQYEEAGVSTD